MAGKRFSLLARRGEYCLYTAETQRGLPICSAD